MSQKSRYSFFNPKLFWRVLVTVFPLDDWLMKPFSFFLLHLFFIGFFYCISFLPASLHFSLANLSISHVSNTLKNMSLEFWTKEWCCWGVQYFHRDLKMRPLTRYLPLNPIIIESFFKSHSIFLADTGWQ